MKKQALKGMQAIVTGANQGLGLEIARHFVAAGADLMLCARDAEKLALARRQLADLATEGQKILSQPADVSRADDVERVVGRTLAELGGCQILVNNAGIYGPKGGIETIDWEDWVAAMQINLFGSVLMARGLVPHFKAQAYGKVIQISGGGATNPLPRLSAYAASKAAVVRFAETLAEELRGTGIDVNAIAPGTLNTRMLDEIIAAGPDTVGRDFYQRALAQKEKGGAPLDIAARLAVFLASSASDGITAKLISALWDDWEQWPAHKAELAASDVYTLRRITGRDRGFDWGDK